MNKLAVMAAAVMLLAAPAFAEAWDFVLINASGKAIKKIEIAPAGTTTWQVNKVEDDIKKEATIASGKRMTVHFDKGSGCKYDVRATFADDSSSTWTGINVCDNAYVTVKLNGGVPTFTAS